MRKAKHDVYVTLEMIIADNPSSSLRTVIFIVTPVFAENAILIKAATFPPITDLPYNLSVWVLVVRAISVPSSGCSERALVSCSVASGGKSV
jgi:hypothetical protein